MTQDNLTDFGFSKVTPEQKTEKVGQVFSSVAVKYDIMNDLMSLGIHRYWKRTAVNMADIRPGQVILDLAGGTGDITQLILKKLKNSGNVVLADINYEMLQQGRAKLLDRGHFKQVQFVEANAESLPFPNNSFHAITIAFGLRNVTDKAKALKEIYRVAKPGGRVIILEFSKPVLPLLAKIYDQYSFSLLPKLGEWVAGDAESYRYLAESIRMHPDQETLKQMCSTAGFDSVDYVNLSGGIVAVHHGYKF